MEVGQAPPLKKKQQQQEPPRSQQFFGSSTRVQWLFDSMPAAWCGLDARDLAAVSATCVACRRLAWPGHMARRPAGLKLSPRGAVFLVKAIQRGGPSASSWALSSRRGAATVAAAVAAGRSENRWQLCEAGAVDVLVRALAEDHTDEARATLVALRSLAGDSGESPDDDDDETTVSGELARLDAARTLFELGAPRECRLVFSSPHVESETRCEALRCAAALCGDFADFGDADDRRAASQKEEDVRAMRAAFPAIFTAAIDATFVRSAVDVAADGARPARERRLALSALSSLAGHSYAAELGAASLSVLGSARTIEMCAAFLPWDDDADEEQRDGSEDAFDLLLSLLVTAVPRDDGDVLTRTRAARIQRAPGAISALVHHVRTGRARRFNEDDAFLTVANVSVCLLADIFQVNPMSCVDPDVDDALVDHPNALALLADAIPDLIKTLSDPPCVRDWPHHHHKKNVVDARNTYWAAGDSCPGGECINLLRVLARRGYSRQVRDAGAVPVLEAMDRFCLDNPKHRSPRHLAGTHAPSYTWNSAEVRLLVVDLFADLLRAPNDLTPADVSAALTTTTALLAAFNDLQDHFPLDAHIPFVGHAASQTH